MGLNKSLTVTEPKVEGKRGETTAFCNVHAGIGACEGMYIHVSNNITTVLISRIHMESLEDIICILKGLSVLSFF